MHDYFKFERFSPVSNKKYNKFWQKSVFWLNLNWLYYMGQWQNSFAANYGGQPERETLALCGSVPGVISRQTPNCEHNSAQRHAVFSEISFFQEENIDFTPSFVVLEQPATAIQRVGILPGHFADCSSKRQRNSQELLIKSRINKKLHAIHHIENQWGYSFCTGRDTARDDRIILVVRSDGQDRFGYVLWAGWNGQTKVLFLVLKML